MLTDVFIFQDELGLLDLRLSEHGPVVDQFVLVELPYSLSGKRKGYVTDMPVFQEKFKGIGDKLRIVRVAKVPGETEAWALVARQRMAFEAALTVVEPGSAVMVSDVRRISRAKDIREALDAEESMSLRHIRYWWSFWGRSGVSETGSVVMPYRDAAEFGLFRLWMTRTGLPRIHSSGWRLDGFRSPEMAAEEFNMWGELPTMNELRVNYMIDKKEDPDGNLLNWQMPKKEHVPELAWIMKEQEFSPFFHNASAPIDEQMKRVRSIRDLPFTRKLFVEEETCVEQEAVP
jgi:hypothetical protein